jgi:hypothetical protein
MAGNMPKLQSRKQTVRKRSASLESVFLNIPYDPKFENLFLAYIAAVSAFGFIPRATLEIPSSQRRLERILALIEECQYSVHDLSRVQLDRTRPSTPRFNMPFELGLAIGMERSTRINHIWVVCESEAHRIQKSLSDLNGTDIYVHDGTIRGVFREFGSIFVRNSRQPTVQEMMAIYQILRRNLAEVLGRAGQQSPFNPRVFRDLCVIGSLNANALVSGNL